MRRDILRKYFLNDNLQEIMSWNEFLKFIALRDELRYDKNPIKCVLCGKALSYKNKKGKFCNHSCAGIYNNQQRGEKRYCLICGKLLSPSQEFFCSRKHFWEHKQKEYKDNVVKFSKFPINGATGGVRRVRKFLISERGHQCEICQISKWQNQPVPLVLDHIDGNPNNWSIFNLRLVCRNCDGLLPTFAGKNIGKFKSNRYKWRDNLKSS